MDWTEQQRDVVRALWREGKSASQIAGAFDVVVSRCAVIGQLKRMGESELTRSHRSKRSPRSVNNTRRGPVRSLKFAGRDYSDAIRDKLPPCDGIDFAELAPHHCRFPTSGLGVDMKYCGALATLGSYCEPHYILCTGGWK